MVRREDVLPWFQELNDKAEALTIHKFGMVGETKAHDTRSFQAWMSEAEAAIDEVFPPTHAIRTKWAKAEKGMESFNQGAYLIGDAVLGVFQAALKIVQSDRLGSLLELIRVETGNDLLDQALNLLNANHRAAAAVISGGVLEAHLRGLCTKYELKITGDGSISKYDGAIAQARNQATAEIYSATDSKQVSAWGGMRNNAAHDPAAFNSTKDEVQRMVDGIRDFISRTT